MIEHISFSPSLQTSDNLELLRETVGRFQRIFNGSGYGFWEWNLQTQHIEWSGGFWERLGYGAEDAESISDSAKVLMYMHPDDHDYAIEATRQHLRTGKPLDVSYRIRTKAGDYIWTQVRADSLRDENGHATIMSGVNFDITEIKKVENSLFVVSTDKGLYQSKNVIIATGFYVTPCGSGCQFICDRRSALYFTVGPRLQTTLH